MSSDNVYRCRKCRCILFSDENVATEHGFQMHRNSDSNELERHSEEELVCSMADLRRQTQWYIRIDDDNTPPWIQQSVERENWLKGKLNCPKCRGRVGSFDFISVSKCPCGKYSKPAVHVLCSRVDHSSKSITKDLPLLPVASAVPRSRTSLGSDRVQRQTSSENILTTSDGHSDCSLPDGHHGNRTLANPMVDNVLRELPSSLSAFGDNLDDLNNNDHGIGNHDNKEFHGNNRTVFSPLEENAVRNQNPSLFCAENGHYDENWLPNSETLLTSNSPEYDCERIRSQGDSSGRSCLPLSGAGSRNNQSVHSSSPYEDMVDVLNIVEAMTSGASRQTSSESRKRSKLKRRRQRQRSQGQEVEGEPERQKSDNRFSLLVKEPNSCSSTEDGLQRGDNFSVTEETPVSDDHLCSVCLDLYYEPHLCNPCGHVFCEPCLRKLARAKPIKTICPLCREIIVDCHKNKDLKDTLMESYSQRYKDRHRTERKFCSDNFYALPRAWLYRYVPDNTHNSRKTWMTVLVVVLGIFIFFPPALGNVLTLLDALFTVLSIYDLVTII